MNQAVHIASQQAADPQFKSSRVRHMLTSSLGDYGQATLPLWVSDLHF